MSAFYFQRVAPPFSALYPNNSLAQASGRAGGIPAPASWHGGSLVKVQFLWRCSGEVRYESRSARRARRGRGGAHVACRSMLADVGTVEHRISALISHLHQPSIVEAEPLKQLPKIVAFARRASRGLRVLLRARGKGVAVLSTGSRSRLVSAAQT